MVGNKVACRRKDFACIESPPDADVYTLYRNSVLDPTRRLHIATLDAAEGAEYNTENCNLAANLLKRQGGVTTGFWCESGCYRE